MTSPDPTTDQTTGPGTGPAPTTRTVQVPGATLTYDVRGDLADATPASPVLLLFGSPMGASGFGTLASHFPDRVVVTYDPRGVERSERDDPTAVVSPDVHAEDLHHLLDHLGGGPVDMMANSGGAVNALALVERHPEQVRTLVAHEPPLCTVLPDREAALAGVRHVLRTYETSGLGAGMAGFIGLTGWQGTFPEDPADLPVGDPAMFGLPSEDDGSRDDPLLGQNLLTCTHHEPDLDALTAASTRVVLAVGATSGEQLAARATRALAEQLGQEPVRFPGDHGGFMGDEYGMPGEPEGFAAALREVLAEPAR